MPKRPQSQSLTGDPPIPAIRKLNNKIQQRRALNAQQPALSKLFLEPNQQERKTKPKRMIKSNNIRMMLTRVTKRAMILRRMMVSMILLRRIQRP